MRRPGCGRSAKPKCEPEGGTLAGQGANDADHSVTATEPPAYRHCRGLLQLALRQLCP